MKIVPHTDTITHPYPNVVMGNKRPLPVSADGDHIEFIPVRYDNPDTGCRVYRVKKAGEPDIFAEVWDIRSGDSGNWTGSEEILSADEVARADRIIPAGTRSTFIRRHVILRSVLSRYLRTPAEKICFSYNPYGRPEIKETRDSGRIFFNMSHADGRILIAVSRHFQPGIDCAAVKAGPDIMGIARIYFHGDVADYLASLALPERRYQFFRTWVHAEACMKAVGTGLALPPGTISFPPALPVPPVYRLTSPDNACSGSVLAMDLPSDGNSVAACAFHLSGGSTEHIFSKIQSGQ